MASKEPKVISIEDFAKLADAPVGKGGQVKKINWESVLVAIRKKPMSSASVHKLICEDKPSYMFNEKADNPNPGTIWTQLKRWVEQKILAKKVDEQGNVFYGPAAKKAKATK